MTGQPAHATEAKKQNFSSGRELIEAVRTRREQAQQAHALLDSLKSDLPSADALDGDRIDGVKVDGELLTADHYVLALGSYSPQLLAPLGMRAPVYPLKGFSITVPRGAVFTTVDVVPTSRPDVRMSTVT